MARKTSADMAKQKAAKQKKMAIGLSVLLVLAGGYAVKTMMGLQSGGTQPVAASTTPTTTPVSPTATPTSTPVATPTASLAAPTLAVGTPSATAGAPTTGADDLVSAVTPTLDVGQMQTFDKFSTKDPFANGTKTTASTSTSTPKTKPKTTPKTTPAPPKPPAVALTSAVLSVNGVQEGVNVGATFPAASPMFQLMSLTAKTAKVSIVGGSYSTGAASTTLTVGTPTTLVNTATGTRYTLILYPQGTAAPASAPTSTTPTSTTPATTTPSGP